ncbi:MAG TPA: sigma-70 family RNA polymerase sigma factor [Sedimentisphaerales bacterium]|nr:sigma-70 family RNA polymerase sigma factor [Sedimentisphaerales bacterium]
MVAYPSYMALSVVSGRIGGIGLEQFLAGRVRAVADSVSVVEGRRRNAPDTAELEDVRQSRQGDSDAYRRLIERHQEHVSGILWRFSRDRLVHEELVQDVFVEAYMSLRSYRGKAPFEHWLSRIATRVGYRYWKQTARRRETENFTLEEWDRVPDGSAEQMDPSEAASLVHRLLAQLRPRDRLVLTLRYLEGCDVAETARRTGWTRGMVKVQTLRAKKRLEKLIAKAGKGLE